MYRFITCVCLSIALFLTGCATQVYSSGAVSYNPDSVKEIKRGVTTMDEVEELLGDPTNTIELEDGEEIWVYQKKNVRHSGSKEAFMAVPLFNVMSGSADKTSKKVLDKDIVRIRFLDEVVDEYVMGQQEMTTEYLESLRTEFNKLKVSHSFQRLEFSPQTYKAPKVKGKIDIQGTNVEYREVRLSFDLTKLPPDISIHRAYLAMVPTYKKIAAKRIRKNRFDLYAPVIYLTNSNWTIDPGGFAASCFQSDCKYKLSGETISVGRVFTSVFAPGADRNVYILKKDSWEYWDVTKLLKMSKSLGRVYLRGASVLEDYIGNQFGFYAENLPPAFDYVKHTSSDSQSSGTIKCKLIMLISEESELN